MASRLDGPRGRPKGGRRFARPVARKSSPSRPAGSNVDRRFRPANLYRAAGEASARLVVLLLLLLAGVWLACCLNGSIIITTIIMINRRAIGAAVDAIMAAISGAAGGSWLGHGLSRRLLRGEQLIFTTSCSCSCCCCSCSCCASQPASWSSRRLL